MKQGVVQILPEPAEDQFNKELRRAQHDIQGKFTNVKAFSDELHVYIHEVNRLLVQSSSGLPGDVADSILRLINDDLTPCSDYLQASTHALQQEITQLFSSGTNLTPLAKGPDTSIAIGPKPPDSHLAAQESASRHNKLALVEKDPLRIFVLDDDSTYIYLITRYLNGNTLYSISVDGCSNPIEGIEHCVNNDYDLVLVDHNLPQLSGAQFLDALNERMKDTMPPAIVLTAESDQAIAGDALRANAADFLSKKVLTRKSLSRSIHNAICKHRLKQSILKRTLEVQSANEELTTKNREIQDFYQNLSHEVKTPLAATREFISILNDGLMGPLSTDQREILDLALASCDQIKDHFNDLVEMSRLDAGKVTLQPKRFTLDSVLIRSLASCAESMKEKHIQVIQHIDAANTELTADENRLTQVLSNLLGNASKYAPTGSIIHLTVRSIPNDYIEFCVTDTGQGIDKSEHEKIFRRLYQSTDIHDESTGAGLGLGLAISREIVRLHGGDIWVESELGKGSQFYFRIPTKES